LASGTDRKQQGANNGSIARNILLSSSTNASDNDITASQWRRIMYLGTDGHLHLGLAPSDLLLGFSPLHNPAPVRLCTRTSGSIPSLPLSFAAASWLNPSFCLLLLFRTVPNISRGQLVRAILRCHWHSGGMERATKCYTLYPGHPLKYARYLEPPGTTPTRPKDRLPCTLPLTLLR
jgi:hypothetical protein